MSWFRSLRFAQIGVFVACLGVPAGWFALGARGEPVDNRLPFVRPALDVSNLFDTEETAAFDAYFDDAFPLRDEAIELDARVARALGDSPNPDVVVGRNGWLFLRESVDQPCLTAEDVVALVSALDRADRLVTATGRELVNVVAPDKATIFTDRLTSAPTCALANADLLSELGTRSTVVSAWSETRAIAAVDDRSYFELDTHWTATGAAPTARKLIDHLAPGRWRDDAIVTRSPRVVVGDLTVLLGLRESETEVPARAQPGPDPATETPIRYTDRDGVVVEHIESERVESGWTDAIGGQTVMLHDSFGDRFTELTTEYFANITTVNDPSPRRSVRTIVDAHRIIRLQVQRKFIENVIGADLAAEFAIALEHELIPLTVTGDCAAGCAVERVDNETYLIATLAPGQPSASVEFAGRRFELDAFTPAAAWFLTADADVRIAGDAGLVVVTAVAVP